MMRKHRSAVLLVIIVLLAETPAGAIPIPALNLPELTSGSALIVVGQVIGVSEDGAASVEVGGRSVPARRMLARLHVSRVLKGRADASDISFGFVIPDVPLGYAGVAANQFGMFFLRRSPQQTLEVANPYYPSIVAARDAPAVEGEAFEQVVAELAYVVTAPKTSNDERVRAVNILEKVLTPTVTRALKQAAQGEHGAVSVHAAAVLLRRNDIQPLEAAAKALLAPPQETEAGLRRTLAYSIRDGVSDERAVPVLARLLRADDVEVRRSAAAALRHVASESVIEPLSSALRDGDREVRYQAVLGLAAASGQSEWAPSVDLFEADEQRYITFWKDWLKVR
jgi:hypothetical protein